MKEPTEVDIEKDTMLTTIDNPFDPFEDWDKWNKFDESKGYYTCSLLAREAKTSDEMSEADEALIIEQAMRQIVKMNLSGKHKIVTRT